MLSLSLSRAIALANLFICVHLLSSVATASDCPSLFTEVRKVTSAREAGSSEFSGIPNDAQNGFVTDKTPITADSISRAYKLGVFPWDVTPQGNGVWFSPPRRGVLDLNLDIGASDRKALRKLEAAIERGELRVSFDEAFEKVITACAAMPRLRRNPVTLQLDSTGTWITEDIVQGYHGMFKNGKAHSIEIWRGAELVAGMYGVLEHGVFTGESMFHTIPEVGKLALFKMSERLRSRGFEWMDTQIAPPTSTSLSVKWGAVEISREEFRLRLTEAEARGLTW